MYATFPKYTRGQIVACSNMSECFQSMISTIKHSKLKESPEAGQRTHMKPASRVANGIMSCLQLIFKLPFLIEIGGGRLPSIASGVKMPSYNTVYGRFIHSKLTQGNVK